MEKVKENSENFSEVTGEVMMSRGPWLAGLGGRHP